MRETSLDEFHGGDDEGDGEPGHPDDDAGGDQQSDDGGEPRPVDGSPATETSDEGTAAARGSGGDEEGEAGVDADRPLGTDGPAEGEPSGTDTSATPAVSTFAWTPDGAACAACGELAERHWRDDGDLVCAACKTW